MVRSPVQMKGLGAEKEGRRRTKGREEVVDEEYRVK